MPVWISSRRPAIGSNRSAYEREVLVERVCDSDVAGSGIGAGVLASQCIDQRIPNPNVIRMSGFGHRQIGWAT